MAKGQDPIGTRRFDKSLNEDVNSYHLPDNAWTHARNAINNSRTGDIGKLGNEPSNFKCIEIKYKTTVPGFLPIIIGTIHLVEDVWAIFSTDKTRSEIGIFKEDSCKYTAIVNAKCLNFNPGYLIKGVSRPTSKCNFTLYWDDGLNPSRTMSVIIDPLRNNKYNNPLTPIPWVVKCFDQNGKPFPDPNNADPNYEPGCIDCQNINALDCDKLRLARFIKKPCVTVSKGFGSGTLLNGSYMVAVAYAIDGIKISDWYVSNVQPLFDHDNVSCSLDVKFEDMDLRYDEVQVAIISITNGQTASRLAGTYNTRQKNLSFDIIDNTWPAIPIEQIPIMTPIADKSDAMYSVNDYLLRVGPTSKFDFNYQPLANQIVTKWQSVEYPDKYYRNGGNNVGYLKDEVYAFFIRWIYDTGDKSSAYHIPGRSKGQFWTNPWDKSTPLDDAAYNDPRDAQPELDAGFTPETWQVFNTAAIDPAFTPYTLADGGTVIAEGVMGYWESSEKYPDNKQIIWNSVTNPLGGGFNTTINPYSTYGSTSLNDLDLCGKPIRHHKFPDINLGSDPGSGKVGPLEYYNPVNEKIRLLGVNFENIQPPLLNDGITLVPGIVGYEILRGTRNGNKTILAKGLICNMRKYDLTGESKNNTLKGSFANYPYNEIAKPTRPDIFLSSQKVLGTTCDTNNTPASDAQWVYIGQEETYKDFFTFHSPDTSFTNPFLSAKEVKIHGEFNGDIVGKFEFSEKHPKHKLLTDWAFLLASFAGMAIAALEMNGERQINYKQPAYPGYSFGAIGGAANSVGAPAATTLLSAPLNNFALLGESWAAELLKTGGAAIGGASAGFLIDNIANALDTAQYLTNTSLGVDGSFSKSVQDVTYNDGAYSNIPTAIRFAFSSSLFFNYFARGTDTALELIRSIIQYRDHALRYHSHVFYSRYKHPQQHNTRRVIENIKYMGPQILDFDQYSRVNNLYRSSAVIFKTDTTETATNGQYSNLLIGPAATDHFAYTLVDDISRVPATAVNDLWDGIYGSLSDSVKVIKDPTKAKFSAYSGYNTYSGISPGVTPGNAPTYYVGHSGVQIASSHYVSLKQRVRNQYGQINNIKMVPVSVCLLDTDKCTVKKEIPDPDFFPDPDPLPVTPLTPQPGPTPDPGPQPNPNTDVPEEPCPPNAIRNAFGNCECVEGYAPDFDGNCVKISDEPVECPSGTIYDPKTGNCITPGVSRLFSFGGCKSGTLFGGDVYLGRYTEKNTFFFFYDWLYDQPDGFQFNYAQHVMIPYPRYWANFNRFNTAEYVQTGDSLFTSLVKSVKSLFSKQSSNPSSLITPRDYYNLNGDVCIPFGLNTFKFLSFEVKYAWFYLFNSGVKDFYVESEINIDLRDWGSVITEEHYDPWRFTDTKSLFDTLYIKSTNYYKYDFSLSYSKLWLNYLSWGNVQMISYDPLLTEFCYVYRPKRVIYSLQARLEDIKDNWYTFLPNNYYDFRNTVSCIKPVNKSGAFIFFDADSPQQFFGVDQLQTTGGTKLTIGDGGLFSQPLQSIVNTDKPYEYASCQDRLAVINIPDGLYWISQNQGKIFNYGGGLKELSSNSIKWWLATYLPSRLLTTFPNFAIVDNPVVGIGTQSIFDNQNGILYFTKKDYQLKNLDDENLFPKGTKVVYDLSKMDDTFLLYPPGATVGTPFKLTDGQGNLSPQAAVYFEDASWTISYDPKIDSWISYHDWHPSLVMPGKNTFMTVKGNAIYKHNVLYNSYCNFYGVNYPFEVEYNVNTAQAITTLRSIEYQLECYKYATNGFDRFHELDYNFDEAVIYNTEQVSGLLILTLNNTIKLNPQDIISYPKYNPNIPAFDILFSKEENKYRFNQFWDITNNRGEYNPAWKQVIWDTAPNGYVRTLNGVNLDYIKDPLQRKKFRHYTNTVFLRKKASSTNIPVDTKMLVILTNNKELYSPR